VDHHNFHSNNLKKICSLFVVCNVCWLCGTSREKHSRRWRLIILNAIKWLQHSNNTHAVSMNLTWARLVTIVNFLFSSFFFLSRLNMEIVARFHTQCLGILQLHHFRELYNFTMMRENWLGCDALVIYTHTHMGRWWMTWKFLRLIRKSKFMEWENWNDFSFSSPTQFSRSLPYGSRYF
jgi:hypothetical protein